VAIVTGASRGIGEAIARAFAAHGAAVVLAARKPDSLHQVAESIGQRALPVPTHTGKEADCAALVAKAVERFGKVDVLVNNAATNPYFGPLLGIDMGAWDKTFEVNLKGYFFMAREVARHLQDRNETKGSIIHVASVNGLEAAPLQGVYGMTKAAVISMTKTMAYELASSKLSCRTALAIQTSTSGAEGSAATVTPTACPFCTAAQMRSLLLLGTAQGSR
jgi:NAD(P)-dependent dehydrogenase (short-subunit alcohol dehydrogenase family)